MDIGCGYGVPAAWFLERYPGAAYTGIDPDAGRVRVVARIAGENSTVKAGGAPDIPMVSKPVNLVIMLDIVHFLGDDELKQTLQQIHNRIKPGGHLLLRAAVPPTRRAPWAWWFDNFRLKLNQVRPCHRSPEQIKSMLIQANFAINLMQPSGTKGELVWFSVSKKIAS